MTIRPEELAELLAIPVEAAQLILVPPPDMNEQQLHTRLQELVPRTKSQLWKDERSWIWEIHKNCDQLIHQRLASFTAAQAMTLASFSVLTVARFNATGMPSERLWLLDYARVWVIAFGIFLAAVGWLVTYPMFKRLKYLNQTFLFPKDKIYLDYFDCIKWKEKTWNCSTKKLTMFPYPLYNKFIPLWLPVAEGLFWLILLGLLVIALMFQNS